MINIQLLQWKVWHSDSRQHFTLPNQNTTSLTRVLNAFHSPENIQNNFHFHYINVQIPPLKYKCISWKNIILQLCPLFFEITLAARHNSPKGCLFCSVYPGAESWKSVLRSIGILRVTAWVALALVMVTRLFVSFEFWIPALIFRSCDARWSSVFGFHCFSRILKISYEFFTSFRFVIL